MAPQKSTRYLDYDLAVWRLDGTPVAVPAHEGDWMWVIGLEGIIKKPAEEVTTIPEGTPILMDSGAHPGDDSSEEYDLGGGEHVSIFTRFTRETQNRPGAFKVGDQVEPTIGGSAMTVERVEGDLAHCYWQDKNKKVIRDKFPMATLKTYKRRPMGIMVG